MLIFITKIRNSQCVRTDVSAKTTQSLVTGAVLPFQPKYRLGHPEDNLFSLSIKNIFRIKVPKNTFHLIFKTEALRRWRCTTPTASATGLKQRWSFKLYQMFL